jgi:hypothetical protein
METNAAPQATDGAEPAQRAEAVLTIAEDRLEGAEAIGRFIDPNMTAREARRLLEDGHYPCWREGRVYVASKAALLSHWRAMTAQLKPGQPRPPRRPPTRKSFRRGYLVGVSKM